MEIIYAGKYSLPYSVARHVHNSWELIYCTGGDGQLLYDGGAIPYQRGDLLIIPPMIAHQNESKHGFTNIHLNMREPRLQLAEPALIREEGEHFLLDAMEAAFYYFSSDAKKHSALLSAYGDLIIRLIEEKQEMPQYSPVVYDIRQAIIRNYPNEDFSLEEYLHALPFNYDYLRKLFKNELGVTPHQFLSQTRLQTAAERLSYPDQEVIRVSEVAHFCGFKEPLYFTRMFKKKYGLSPTEYQREQRENHGTGEGGEYIRIRD